MELPLTVETVPLLNSRVLNIEIAQRLEWKVCNEGDENNPRFILSSALHDYLGEFPNAYLAWEYAQDNYCDYTDNLHHAWTLLYKLPPDAKHPHPLVTMQYIFWQCGRVGMGDPDILARALAEHWLTRYLEYEQEQCI